MEKRIQKEAIDWTPRGRRHEMCNYYMNYFDGGKRNGKI